MPKSWVSLGWCINLTVGFVEIDTFCWGEEIVEWIDWLEIRESLDGKWGSRFNKRSFVFKAKNNIRPQSIDIPPTIAYVNIKAGFSWLSLPVKKVGRRKNKNRAMMAPNPEKTPTMDEALPRS